jgi:hypothetical protein
MKATGFLQILSLFNNGETRTTSQSSRGRSKNTFLKVLSLTFVLGSLKDLKRTSYFIYGMRKCKAQKLSRKNQSKYNLMYNSDNEHDWQTFVIVEFLFE